ncbi:MAG: hypothetical protein EKK55_06990 [Rhodocyclaceae bacterium]|nr:MAG: hypothetical protein EKK55_06990 [Rhodocyclaceae bacterium]
MSYLEAPATAMIAEFCACCSRALVDADSVETGVGPECRKKHGYDVASGPADWTAALHALEGALELLPEGWEVDARRVANVLVHRIACAQQGPGVIACINALRALGYDKLAARVAKRLAKIVITEAGDTLSVKTPFDEAAVEILRRAPGRYVGKGTREIPNTAVAKRALLALLRTAYPNAIASGPKGVFVLEAA